MLVQELEFHSMGEKKRQRSAEVVPIAKRLQQSAELELVPKKVKSDDLEDQIKRLEAQLESSDSSSEDDSDSDDDDDNEDEAPGIVKLSAYQDESVPALPPEMLPKPSCQSGKVSTHQNKPKEAPAPPPKIVGKVPFACKPCGFVGKDLEDFKNHKASGEHADVVRVATFSCKLCSKDFTSADQLTEHKAGKWHQMRKRTKKSHFQATAAPRVCYDFLRGNCFRGDACSFDHAASDKPSSKQASIQRPTRVCNQFQAGTCKFGDRCIFRHDKS
ncbi:unnamed protein product [Aphanomyces euteiches]